MTNEEPEGIADSEVVDRYLRRIDLLDEGAPPQNVLEWIIVLANKRIVQVGLVVLLAIGSTILAATGATEIAMIGGYFVVFALLVMTFFWLLDRIEAAIGLDTVYEESDESEIPIESLPEEVRVQLRRDR